MTEELTILKDCYCEEYLHEMAHYYRDGLVERKLKEGDRVLLVKKWSNLYGTYLRVQKEGELYLYDINPDNANHSSIHHKQ